MSNQLDSSSLAYLYYCVGVISFFLSLTQLSFLCVVLIITLTNVNQFPIFFQSNILQICLFLLMIFISLFSFLASISLSLLKK